MMATNAPINVLLIEDNPTDIRLVQEILRGTPSDRFNITSASTLAKGLERLSSDQVDVILLDLGLPDSQGLDSLRHVKEHTHDVPIIVLTVSATEELGLEAVHEGAQQFFSKDILTPDGAYAEMFPHVIHFAIEQKRVQAALLRERDKVQKLNTELQSKTEELRVANEGLEQRVEERTEALREMKERLEVYSEQQALLNLIISEGNRAPDLREALQAMLDTAMKVADVDCGAVYLLNEAEGTIELQYAHGIREDVLSAVRRFPVTASYYQYVYEGRPLFFDDFAHEGTGQFKELFSELHTAAIIPLIAQDRAIGHYLLGSSKVRGFADDERTLLVAAGHQVGTVVARLQAEEALKEQARRQDILTRIISAGNNATSLRSALVAMLDTALELLTLDNGGIFLRDGDTMTLQYQRGYTAEQRAWTQRIPITQRRVARIMEGTPWISDDYQADVTQEVREMNEDVASMATVPLMAGDAVVGFYQLVSLRRLHHFTDEERGLLVSIGQEAGTVIARLLAEQALKQSEARLNKLVEQSFDAVFIHSDGIVRFANGVAARILKAARPEDLVGLDSLAFPTDEFRELVKERIALIYETHPKTEPVEMQFKTVDGAVVDVESMATDTVWEGKPAVYVAFRDITEKKRAEKELKRYAERLEDLVEERTAQLAQSEEEFRTLVETANSLIFTLDNEGIITYVNAFGARSLGYAPDELIGHNVMIIVPDTDSSGRDMTPYINDIVARPDEHTVSVNENVTKDGRRLWFNWVNKILTDEEGNHIGHLAIGNEVTEQLRIQRALQDSEERYRTLVETAHSIILTVDNHGSITFINNYGAHFFGYTPDELVGKHTMILVPPVESTGRDLTTHIDDVIAHPDEHAVSLNENITKDGRRVLINWVNHILTDREGHHIGHLTMGYDVTEQKRAEDALRDAQRLAGIGQTAAMIGHDLRNPLQGLQYIVDLQKLRFERMASADRSTEEWQKEEGLFDRISEQIFYMDKIVGDLQDFARPIDVDHEEITIRTIIDDVLESLPPSDAIETVINVSDQTFVVDPHLMLRVFSNLVLNAVQAMPKGGTLTIGAEAIDGSVAIHVSDTGVGIPAEMRDKLFSPLTTGKAKGTGLGLAVVKRIVEAHNGTITFETEEWKGTTFTITLPQMVE